MKECHEFLLKGICFKIGKKLVVHTFEDAWIPDLPNLRLPSAFQDNKDYSLVRNLMTHDELSWDKHLVEN